MAMMARNPVCGSWQNTTCSCPPRELLAKTFVTVVTLLASSRVLVDADSRQAYAWPGTRTIRPAPMITDHLPRRFLAPSRPLAATGFANCLKASDALEQRSDQWLSQIVPKLTA